MATRFSGRKTGFNPSGSNDCVPNAGPPKTKFTGRGAVPGGDLKKNYPGAVADISGGNRRTAKAAHGDGGGSSTVFNSRTAFGKGGSRKGK